ncbi:MAG TPA: ribosome-associated translation inhibitor RaiA [Deltaproteobacteria bacterium]|jgi:putative sigma-54 modulation protein|nr:ribosome-associated translation inhibitor RaiA [Deltaproteobacteria bacterium]HOI06754.1 ribosome-associated translation inhibitor RaiA [Deltaproteobacteria bacterium]
MQLDITFKNIDSTDALKDYATKRFSKLDKYVDKPSEVHVVLSVEKRRHTADVTLSADGVIINAVEITEDLYSAIDMVMDKLERQVKKHKEKLQEKKGGKAPFEGAPEAPAPKAARARKKPKVVYERDYFIQPMSADDAILQMGTTDAEFILFQNSDTKQINLIYKRPDGSLGIVETLS